MVQHLVSWISAHAPAGHTPVSAAQSGTLHESTGTEVGQTAVLGISSSGICHVGESGASGGKEA